MTSPPDEPPSSPYHGQDLVPGRIRLLTIHWTTSDEFELRTECHNLTEDLKFDAISYVWGTAPASVRVKCNDAILSITPMAFEMLGYLHLYKPEPSRPIWIDAICINQEDADEKAEQIALMYQIYSHAESVIVWMGCPSWETSIFMTGMSQIAAPWHCEPASSEIDRRWPYHSGPFWTGIYQLLFANWLRRLWTLQEAVLARKLIALSGSLWLDLDDLMEFVFSRYIYGSSSFGRGGTIDFYSLEQWSIIKVSRIRRPYRISPKTLLNFLVVLRGRQVREEVDRIWALYGLFEEEFRSRLAPLIDYSDLARREHWRTLIACLKVSAQMHQHLRVLIVPSSEYPRPPYLPSWCPDLRGRGAYSSLALERLWSTRSEARPEPGLRMTEDAAKDLDQKFQAISQHPNILIATMEENNFLYCNGFEVDTVAEIAEETGLVGPWAYTEDYATSAGNFNNSNPLHVIAMEWISRSEDLARRTCREKIDPFTKLPLDFHMSFWADDQINANSLLAYEDLMIALRNGNYNSLSWLPQERKERALRCKTRFQWLIGHTFFSTKGGRFGVATAGCKPGDKVCVFYGGEPLYIVRPHDNVSDAATKDPKKLWEYCGIAFLPRLMDQHTTDDARQGRDQMFILA